VFPTAANAGAIAALADAARLVHVASEHDRLPRGKMDLAMQLIFTPMIRQLMERRRAALVV